MATLYDLELQESNNFIHALAANGETPALKLMVEQKDQMAAMGEAGAELVKQLEDPESEMGKSFKRLQDMQADIAATMKAVGMESTLAKKANDIFSTSPDSLDDLSDEQRSVIKDYWLKKKTVIVLLIKKGYSHEEMFG